MATIHLCRSKQQPQFEKHHWQKTAHGHSHWTCPGPAGRPVAGFSITHGCHRFCFGWVVCTLHSNETTMLPIDLSSGFELATIGPFLSPTKIYWTQTLLSRRQSRPGEDSIIYWNQNHWNTFGIIKFYKMKTKTPGDTQWLAGGQMKLNFQNGWNLGMSQHPLNVIKLQQNHPISMPKQKIVHF